MQSQSEILTSTVKTTAKMNMTQDEKVIEVKRSEELGRQLFAENVNEILKIYFENETICKITDLVYSEYIFSKWDIMVSAEDKSGKQVKFVVEVKTRRNAYDAYPTSICETDKYEFLTNTSLGSMRQVGESKGYDVIPIYINFFKDGKYRFWDCRDLKLDTDYEIQINTSYKQMLCETVTTKRVFFFNRKSQSGAYDLKARVI